MKYLAQCLAHVSAQRVVGILVQELHNLEKVKEINAYHSSASQQGFLMG